jgi:hypothetical protein
MLFFLFSHIKSWHDALNTVPFNRWYVEGHLVVYKGTWVLLLFSLFYFKDVNCITKIV